MIVLVGVFCVLSCVDGKTTPFVFDKRFDTMAVCEKFKTSIMDKIQPADWIDAKLDCVEGQGVI